MAEVIFLSLLSSYCLPNIHILQVGLVFLFDNNKLVLPQSKKVPGLADLRPISDTNIGSGQPQWTQPQWVNDVMKCWWFILYTVNLQSTRLFMLYYFTARSNNKQHLIYFVYSQHHKPGRHDTLLFSRTNTIVPHSCDKSPTGDISVFLGTQLINKISARSRAARSVKTHFSLFSPKTTFLDTITRGAARAAARCVPLWFLRACKGRRVALLLRWCHCFHNHVWFLCWGAMHHLQSGPLRSPGHTVRELVYSLIWKQEQSFSVLGEHSSERQESAPLIALIRSSCPFRFFFYFLLKDLKMLPAAVYLSSSLTGKVGRQTACFVQSVTQSSYQHLWVSVSEFEQQLWLCLQFLC